MSVVMGLLFHPEKLTPAGGCCVSSRRAESRDLLSHVKLAPPVICVAELMVPYPQLLLEKNQNVSSVAAPSMQ